MNGLVVKAHSMLRPLIILEIQERRLFAFCLQHYDSRPDASNPLYFDVPIAKFKEAYPEYKTYKPKKIFDICEEAANGIQSKGYRPDPKKREVVWWFSSLKVIETDEDEGYIRFGLTPDAMPYFLNLKSHYISYHMADVRLMNKPSAWNLYEYLKEKFQNGQRPEWEIAVDELKERLGVYDKYLNRFNNFEKKCLSIPLSDINYQTDIHAYYHKIKKGPKVVKIRFVVVTKCSDPSVINTEDLAVVFRRELDKNGMRPSFAAICVEAAIEQSRVSEMLQMIPKAKKSHAKHGEKPWSVYLAGTLQRELGVPQKNLPGLISDSKRKQIEQENCWASHSTYGCRHDQEMGSKALCEGCEHNKL